MAKILWVRFDYFIFGEGEFGMVLHVTDRRCLMLTDTGSGTREWFSKVDLIPEDALPLVGDKEIPFDVESIFRAVKLSLDTVRQTPTN